MHTCLKFPFTPALLILSPPHSAITPGQLHLSRLLYYYYINNTITIGPYMLKRLSWKIARHFSLYFAFVLPLLPLMFQSVSSFKSISFSSGAVVVVDGVVVVVLVVEDGLMFV